MRYLLALLVFATSVFAHAAVEGELLEPDKAFRFSARVADANMLEVRFQIADGYYMYRDKFQFSVTPATVMLGAPEIPPGKVKQDEFFGRVETFRKDVVIKLPLTRSTPDAQTITLKVISQGCADAGVCYTPQEQFAKLALPAASVTAPAAGLLGGLAQLGADIGGNDDEFLAPEKAFTVNVTVRDANTLVADFKPEPTYYLYRDKIGLTIKGAPGITVEKISLPPGEVKEDPTFGKTEVYHNAVQAIITLKRDANAPQVFEAIAKYQGCSDKGVCYPPLEKSFSLNLANAGTPAAAATSSSGAADGDDDSRVAELFKAGNLWPIVLAFFGFGLLLSFTPCVFPMIPILSGIIVGQGTTLTKWRAFALSLSYVLGMAVTYAVAGVAAGLSGTLLTTALQNPWVLGVFAAVFVALSLSMFGFYDLQLPSFIQSKFSDASNKVKGGNVASVFIMGALSAVIVGPCVAAPLAGALLYIGQTHNVVLGGMALFAMALGMGVPLLLIGTSAGTLLPRAGAWMDAVKGFFGVLLLAVAIYLIGPVIPDYAAILLWAALLIIAAMYLRPLDSLPADASGFKRLWKGIGVIALVWGIAMLVGMLGGNRDVLQPLKFPRSGGAAAPGAVADEAALPFVRVKSVAELEQKLQDHAGQYVMLDFYADWCISCKELERFTFADPAVRQKLSGVVLLQADVTANNADDKALLKSFNLFGPPGIIFFDKSGKESGRVIGFQKPEKFLTNLNRAMP